jgi:hypothetical protein
MSKMKLLLATLCVLLASLAWSQPETVSVKLLKPTLKNRAFAGLGQKGAFPLQIPKDEKADKPVRGERAFEWKAVTIDGKQYDAAILEVGSGRRIYMVGLYTTDKVRKLYRMCDLIGFTKPLGTLSWNSKSKMIVATSVDSQE